MVDSIPSLILASESPRRKRLLTQLSIPFEVFVSGASEEFPTALSPQAAAAYLSQLKARAIPERRDRIVLAADTVIDLRGEILGKPRDEQDARAMLRRLRNRPHRVLTAVTVSRPGDVWTRVVATVVNMAHYSERQIGAYVETGEPMDKAGSYAIQGSGSDLVRSIEGCYTNVVGLPLCETARLLKHLEPRLKVSEQICRLPGGGPCPRIK